MTTKKFNALTSEARRFIENEQGQLCCGKTNNLELIYQNYLQMKNENLFTLRIGAVYTVSEKTKKTEILYPLYATDTEDETKEKLKLALAVEKSNPESFSAINVSEIEKLLGKEAKIIKLPPVKNPKKEKLAVEKKVVDLQKPAQNENNDNIEANQRE